MNLSRGSRSLLLIVAALITVGCGSADGSDSGTPPSDPLVFLAKRPALPPKWVEEGLPRSIGWQRSPLGGRVKLRWCETKAGGFREWSEGGIPHANPYFNQSVCVFAGEDDASDAYESLSLLDGAGEDWPNFEPGASSKTTPTNVSDLDELAAEDWEIGCGIGDPDGVCAVWDFRARYGRVLTDAEFGASGGGIGFSAMRDLIRSIDRHVAARS